MPLTRRLTALPPNEPLSPTKLVEPVAARAVVMTTAGCSLLNGPGAVVRVRAHLIHRAFRRSRAGGLSGATCFNLVEVFSHAIWFSLMLPRTRRMSRGRSAAGCREIFEIPRRLHG